MYNMDAMTELLDTLQFLGKRNWNQRTGGLRKVKYANKPDMRCSACVGAWAAYALGCKPAPARFGEDVGWTYKDGVKALQKLLHVPYGELCRIMVRHGASATPFGTLPWKRAPYPVMRDVVEDITGYLHGTDNWPIKVEDWPEVIISDEAPIQVEEPVAVVA